MAVTLRRITRDEIGPWCDAMAVGFLDVPDPARYPFIEAIFDAQRSTAAFDGNKIVGTYASFTTEITLPGGGVVPANAVAGVTVMPTHRKQSILRSALSADLEQAHERGEPLAILNASEFTIYARFGFGVATESMNVEIDTVGIKFRPSPANSIGRTVELVTADTATPICEPVYAAVQRSRAGVIGRDGARWQEAFGLSTVPEKWLWKGHTAIARDAKGRVDGFVRYHGASEWGTGRPSSNLIVDELITANPAAHRQLLDYLCSMAWVTKVTMEDRPVDDDSHLFIADERRVSRSHRFDQLWARILDVPKVLTARSYEGSERVTIEVHDTGLTEAGYAAGRFTLDATSEGTTCRRSRSKPDVTMDVSELSGIMFGGISFAALERTGRAEEHTAGSALKVDRLFRATHAPWNPTHF
jgi:predicted acetyltransferase